MNAWYVRAQAGNLPTLAVNGCSRDDDPTEHDPPKHPPEPLRLGSPPSSAGAPVAAQPAFPVRGALAGPWSWLRRHFGHIVF